MTLAKFIGRDSELSTTGVDASGEPLDSSEVTQKVLEQIGPVIEERGGVVWSRGASGNHYGGGRYWLSPYSVDSMRQWTSAGQCYYADLCHVEAVTAACLSPHKFAAQSLSTLLVAESARRHAEFDAEPGTRYSLSASNADVLDASISWGTHVNVTVESYLWDDLFVDLRHPAILGFVASALSAAIPFFGAGYLLPMKDGRVIYSLSARAHHLTKLKTLSTTDAFRRGILNTRREPHGEDHDRLHLIGFDNAVLSDALLCSFLQCVLAAAEEGFCGFNLFDPVQALRAWSWNLDLTSGKLPATAALIDGRQLTLPAYLRELVTQLLDLCEGGLITDEIAPNAKDLLPRIIELTHYADEGNVIECARHLTWSAKFMYLKNLCRDDEITFGDATTRLADHDFLNTDPEIGTFWHLLDNELIDPLVTLDEAEACIVQGPAESRAWGRGRIIQQFFDDVTDVNWGYVELQKDGTLWSPRLKIEMPLLDSLNRSAFEPLIEKADSVIQLERLLKSALDSADQDSDSMLDSTPEPALLPENSRLPNENGDGR